MSQFTRPISRQQLLEIVDHTLLKSETTEAECLEFLRDAEQLGVRRICISPTFLGLVSPLERVTVVGFPSGAHTAEAKAFEALQARNAGATEFDVVANVGNIHSANYAALVAELSAVREVTSGLVLKVILETASLSDQEIRSSCLVARDVGCDFVKTSTGFHPAGGASLHAVALMRKTVGEELGVKASGGIRTADQASAMLEAGATRLGLSATGQIVNEWE